MYDVTRTVNDWLKDSNFVVTDDCVVKYKTS